MSEPHVLTIATSDLPPREDSPGTRRISGEPQFRIWNLERAADGSIASGIWETTAGKWHSSYRDKWEFCTVVFGALTITEDGHAPVTYGPGESFVIRDGFTGVWEAKEHTRKHYVVHLAKK